MKKLSSFYQAVDWARVRNYAYRGFPRPTLHQTFMNDRLYRVSSDPSYEFMVIPSVLDEGDVLTCTVKTTNLVNNTILYYTITGTGVSALDFVDDSVSGFFLIQNNKGYIVKQLKSDTLIEGTEYLKLTLRKDSIVGEVLLDSDSITINDTPLVPTYSIEFNKYFSVNEGSSVMFTLTTTNLAEGTNIPYTLTGVSSADIQESLTGSLIVNADGIMTKTFNIAADSLIEGMETLTLTLDGITPAKVISININDTSQGTLIRGEQTYTSYGDYTWVVPAGVASVSCLAVGAGGGGDYNIGNIIAGAGGGGGGLAYWNNVPVTPGTLGRLHVGRQGSRGRNTLYPSTDGGDSVVSFTSVNNVLYAYGGKRGNGAFGGQGGGFAGATGGGNGGKGGNAINRYGAGGGGAAGYTGNGGPGGRELAVAACAAAPDSGGAGGGFVNGSGGGGVGLYGKGATGSSTTGASGGYGGSGGANGGYIGASSDGADGAKYGGGGGGGYAIDVRYGGYGGGGAIRIVYPGATRQFPSTDVA